MKASVLRIISVCLLSSIALAGCGPAGLGRIPRPGEHKEPELYVPGPAEQRRTPDHQIAPKARIGSHPQRWNC